MKRTVTSWAHFCRRHHQYLLPLQSAHPQHLMRTRRRCCSLAVYRDENSWQTLANFTASRGSSTTPITVVNMHCVAYIVH